MARRSGSATVAEAPQAQSDPLETYRRKRDFSITPEPAEGGIAGSEALQFVVQKHWASRLHYDFRLELGGTMKSWAVPKGPSLDPEDKRMAVQVEDHPISYNTFEGQIPPKQYGAGKVIVWDRGYWVPVGDAAEGYRKGKLKFELHGHKLHGHWTLVRMHGKSAEKQPPWLLIKEHDQFERPSDQYVLVDEQPDSVTSLEPIAPPQTKGSAVKNKPGNNSASSKSPLAALPTKLMPQLATLVDAPPQRSEDWLWELKFDGYRLMARVEKGRAQLFTRNGHDWTAKMPDLAEEIAALPLKSGWLDGEVIIMDQAGVPDFQALQNAFDGKATKDLVFYAFDLPFLNGKDLRGLRNEERREMLGALLQDADSDRVRFSAGFDARPKDLVASACKIGFEGVIGKRKDGVYVSKRSADWIKLKCTHRQEFVIIGYTDPRGARKGVGSLLLGVHGGDGALRYAGSVGSGFSERVLADLYEKLVSIGVTECPLSDSRGVEKRAHWVKPKLLAEVSFAEWTKEGKVRHSVFHGLRSDKAPVEIVREEPKSVGGEGGDVSPLRDNKLRVSNPDRVIDATTGLTKLDLVRYYATVAPLLMEHLSGRPVSLVRAPEGIGGELFFQKHLDKGIMKGVHQLPTELHAGHPALLEVVSSDGLLSAAQLNVVEFHTWNARKDRIERPDRITFDLDPGEGVTWAQIQESATLVQVMLRELGLPAFLKTSGGNGLHVVVPLKRLHDWDTAKLFSQSVVQHLAQTIPSRFVSKMGPRNRVGKIFVDYLRNGFGATTASAWSARARPGMGISVPISWSELDKITSGSHWTVRTVGQRLRAGNSPWDGYAGAAASLTRPMAKLQEGG